MCQGYHEAWLIDIKCCIDIDVYPYILHFCRSLFCFLINVLPLFLYLFLLNCNKDILCKLNMLWLNWGDWLTGNPVPLRVLDAAVYKELFMWFLKDIVWRLDCSAYDQVEQDAVEVAAHLLYWAFQSLGERASLRINPTSLNCAIQCFFGEGVQYTPKFMSFWWYTQLTHI